MRLLLVLVLALLCTAAAPGAPELDTVALMDRPVVEGSAVAEGEGPSVTLSGFTVGAANERVLLVGVSARGGAKVASVTFGSQAFTPGNLYGDATCNGLMCIDQEGFRVEVWALPAPEAGTADIVVTFETGSHAAVVGATWYSNADQTAPVTVGNTGSVPSGNSVAVSVNGMNDTDETFSVLSTKKENLSADPDNFDPPTQVKEYQAVSSTVDLLGAGGNGPGSDPITVQWLWNTLSNGVVHPGVAATVNVVAGSGIVVVPNEPPVADAGPDQGIILGETVTLDGSGSSDPDNNIDTYDWDFGDSAVGSGMIVTHTYTAPGTYEAVLTVTDTDGLSDSDTAVVVVKSPEEAVDDLIDDIEDLPIHPGTINSLTSKLENVLAKIENGQKKAALNQLNAFINQVEAQRGNKLTDAQADALIAAAEAIRTAVIASCPPAASLTLLDTRTPNALTLTSRPNPFQGATTVRFRLALDGAAQLAIYDVTGGRVRTLVDSWLAAGEHTVSWDGRNSGGQAVAAGVYYYRLVSGTTQATQRIVRLP